MKKLLISFFYIVFINQLYAQNNSISPDYFILDQAIAECTYLLKYKDNKSLDSTRQETMILYIGENHYSKFASYSRYVAEDLVNKYQGPENGQQLVNEVLKAPKSRFRYRLYKNLSQKTITFQDRVGGTNYQYEESLDTLLTWAITLDQKVINSYKCQKATTHFAGRDYIAWFTTDIPISEGPYKFCGLPGLIIQVYDVEKDYEFTLQNLKNMEGNTPILGVNKADEIKLSKANFTKVVENFKKDPMQSYSNSNMVFPISEDQAKRSKKRLQSRNNPIELQ